MNAQFLADIACVLAAAIVIAIALHCEINRRKLSERQ